MSNHKYSLKYDVINELLSPEAVMPQNQGRALDLVWIFKTLDMLIEIFATGKMEEIKIASRHIIDDEDNELSHEQNVALLAGLFTIIATHYQIADKEQQLATRSFNPFNLLSGFLSLFKFPDLWF